MKKLKTLTYLCIMSGVILLSCEKEKKEMQENNAISSEVLQKIESLQLNADDVAFGKIELPDGTSKSSYLVEGCIAIDPDQLSSMSLHDGVQGEQYRTYNLVSSPRTINVLGYTGSGYALSYKMQSALQGAISNYNSLSTGLYFTLSFGTNTGPYDIVVYQVSGAAGGLAGFPSGGNPYKWVQIYSGMESYSTTVNRHVMTHEIGHCIGLRHTDWYSRQSCGQSGESANPEGAVHIPGTPTGYDASSIMLACFNSGSSGYFGYYDRVALEYLY